MNKFKTILQWMLLTTAIWVAGCTKESPMDELSAEHSSVTLSLSTRTVTNSLGTENESVVNTLRLLIFNSGGVQVKNSSYEGPALDELRKEGGIFIVTERLPRDLGQLRVCLIANEPAVWDLGSTHISYTTLSNLTIHYSRDFDFINNNGNSDDLNLYISPDDYFLMYAETTVNFVAGDVSIAEVLPLKRTAAKVTLTLGYDRLSDVDYDTGENFVLKSTSIQNQPIYSHFFAGTYNNEEFFSTAYQTLEYNQATKVTQPVVFYIPEYYLSADGLNTGLFTYLEVLGEYTTGGMKIPIVYKIPLGEGVQQKFVNNGYVPVIDDYSIVRNHHYVVNGRITKLGEKEGIQAKISIMPWQDGGYVDVDASAPYLNVSDIALKRTVFPPNPDVSDTVFFWSNQPPSLIMLEPVTATYYESNGTEINMSGRPVESLPVIAVNMVKYTVSANGANFFENNGHITIDVAWPASMSWDKFVVTFQVKAGNIKRQITVTYHTGSIST